MGYYRCENKNTCEVCLSPVSISCTGLINHHWHLTNGLFPVRYKFVNYSFDCAAKGFIKPLPTPPPTPPPTMSSGSSVNSQDHEAAHWLPEPFLLTEYGMFFIPWGLSASRCDVPSLLEYFIGERWEHLTLLCRLRWYFIAIVCCPVIVSALVVTATVIILSRVRR